MNRTAITTLLLFVGVALAVMAGVSYFNQPRTAGENLDSAGNALSEGDLGGAIQEMGNQTEGDKVQNDVRDALDVQPAN